MTPADTITADGLAISLSQLDTPCCCVVINGRLARCNRCVALNSAYPALRDEIRRLRERVAELTKGTP